MKKKGFTLAEVLITLAIIGIIAAITIPSLVKNFQQRIRTSRIQNIQQKLSHATDKMMVIDGLNGYGTTQNFINTLSKHLKISKICQVENISDCWPSAIINTTDGDIITTSIKKPEKLFLDSESYDSLVGI